MPLIKDDQLIEDPWVNVVNGDVLPIEESIIVELERWQEARQELMARNGRLGIRLRSDQPPALIAEDLAHFDLVALEFPVFKDGRAFSYARLLRERYGFDGELRAVGQVLRDQLLFMRRCGFDSLEVADETVLDAWHQAKREISVFYQPATDRRPWVAQLRHRAEQASPPLQDDAVAAHWAY